MGTRIRKFDLAKLVKFIESKHVAVPEFQRGFVWKTKQVKDLFDSLVKQYPIGSFVLWETNKFIDARTLDGEKLPKNKMLILDGQQRLASIYYLCRQKKFAEAAVKTKFQESSDSRARDVIDFEKFSIMKNKSGPELEYGRDHVFGIEFPKMQTLVKKTYQFPVVVISLDNYRKAIQVFARINQAGTRISTESIFLSETWNHHSHIGGILRAWKRKNGKALTRRIDTVIFIHVFAVIFQFREKNASAIDIRLKTLKKIAEKICEEKGDTYNLLFREVILSIARAVMYLKEEYGITALSDLPSQTMITVLSVFFYYQKKGPTIMQEKELRKWFWRSSLANRYIGSGYSENIDRDVKKMRALAKNNAGLKIPVATDKIFGKLREIDLRTGRSTYRNTIKQALWQQKPVFINGRQVSREDVESGQHKPDDDHFFPYSLSQKGMIERHKINNILNLHFLNHDENLHKSKSWPSEWLRKRINEIKPAQRNIRRYFRSQLLPFESMKGLKNYEKAFGLKGKAKKRKAFKTDFSRFLKKRYRLFEQTLTRLQKGYSS